MPKCPSKWGQRHLASFTSEDEATQNKWLALVTDVGCWLWGKAASVQAGPAPGQLLSLLQLLSRLWWQPRVLRWEGRGTGSLAQGTVLCFLSLTGNMKNFLLTEPASWRPRPGVSVSLGHLQLQGAAWGVPHLLADLGVGG